MLYVGCGVDWFSQVTGTTYIANFSDWLCRVWQFIYNVIIYAAGWIVVSMSIDRFIIVWNPRQAPYMCTVFMAKLVTIVILVGLVVVSIHAMWTYELTPQGCNIDIMQQDFQTIAWPWISATLCSYIPLVLIFIFQIMLLIGLVYPRSEAVSVTNMNRNCTRSADKISSCRLSRLFGFKFTDHNSELYGVREFKWAICLSNNGQTAFGTNSMPDNFMLKLCRVFYIVFCNGATDEERGNDSDKKTEGIKYLIDRRNAKHGSEHEWGHVRN